MILSPYGLTSHFSSIPLFMKVKGFRVNSYETVYFVKLTSRELYGRQYNMLFLTDESA